MDVFQVCSSRPDQYCKRHSHLSPVQPGLCTFYTLAAVYENDGYFSAPITFISKISYSVYLLHTVLSDFLFKYIYKGSYGLPYQLMIWLAFILVSIGISALSYRYIELPFTQKREKYGSESVTPVPVVKAVREPK
ncbi:hypothetical protein [Paraflavitalea speifideaquila]|uniref:acyltransferase family protein n=1 Tax=Paraflavitalea speifideaquila TaxID=3076558 RepID=UPI0028E22CA4|nr:hypothetical protein [Paraflavitalea speifideiaquila]